jgi:hypothetical protein
VQDEGLRKDHDDIRTTEDSAETEGKEAVKATDRLFLLFTMRSYEVEEIDGGRLGRWILSHCRERHNGRAKKRVASD